MATSGDCNDSNVGTYPNASEVNDGQDNQCPGNRGYGVADEISGTSGFTIPGDKGMFCWPAQSGATSYEVARSDRPNFSPCVSLGTTTAACLSDPAVPPARAVYFYLVRAASPNVGSWGQNSAGSERILSCP